MEAWTRSENSDILSLCSVAPAQSVQAERDGRFSYVEPGLHLACRANGHNEDRPSCVSREETPVVGTIYVLRNKVNGKCYVGQTIHLANRFRYYRHSLRKKIKPTYIENAVLKYGWDSFEQHIFSDLPSDLIDVFEVAMIARLKTQKPGGYNLEGGGNKLKKHHPESLQKRSEAMSGSKHPLFGTHLSEKQRRYLSDFWKGKVFSRETRAKISLACKGRPKSEAHRAACRIAKLGKNMGKDNPKARAIKCLDTGEIFLSMADACRKYGLRSGHLTYCCKGKLKTHGGYHWAYQKESA